MKDRTFENFIYWLEDIKSDYFFHIMRLKTKWINDDSRNINLEDHKEYINLMESFND